LEGKKGRRDYLPGTLKEGGGKVFISKRRVKKVI